MSKELLTYGGVVNAIQAVRAVKNLSKEHKDKLELVVESLPAIIEERAGKHLDSLDCNIDYLKRSAVKKDAEISLLNGFIDKLISAMKDSRY